MTTEYTATELANVRDFALLASRSVVRSIAGSARDALLVIDAKGASRAAIDSACDAVHDAMDWAYDC